MGKFLKDILKKGSAIDSNAKDKQKMFALFHQAENEYELKGNLLEELEKTELPDSSSANFNQLFNRLWSKINEKKKEPRIIKVNSFIKIAAAVVIGLFVGFYFAYLKTDNAPIYYSAHSPRGSISEIILPDESIIFLNSDSRIQYKCDDKKGIREVHLQGEAWFDVKKDKKKPFIVHTPFYDINVTGTQFDVKAYNSDDKITTTLEEGEVRISSSENFNLENEITLTPGEQVVLNKDTKKAIIKTVNTKWFTSWKDNKLIFVNMSLKDLIVLLERKYGVDIEVKNDALLDLHFDGTIKNETILEILEIIKKTLPVNYKITEQKIEISAN
ncbi:MAG: FecR family protein [Prolixibacteraceae bacterium]|nr:FecR family protein [Prolixibacteraceae bacterium]